MITAVAALLVAQATYALRWVPAKGDVSSFEAVLVLSQSGTEVQVLSESKRTVEETSDKGYVVKSESGGLIMRGGGHEERLDQPSSWRLSTAPDGSPLEFLEDKLDPIALRFAVFNHFVAPPKPILVGDHYSIAREAKGDTPSSTTDYTLEGVKSEDGREVATLESTIKETSGDHPGSAKGKWRIDAATGETLGLALEVADFHTPSGDITHFQLDLKK